MLQPGSYVRILYPSTVAGEPGKVRAVGKDTDLIQVEYLDIRGWSLFLRSELQEITEQEALTRE